MLHSIDLCSDSDEDPETSTISVTIIKTFQMQFWNLSRQKYFLAICGAVIYLDRRHQSLCYRSSSKIEEELQHGRNIEQKFLPPIGFFSGNSTISFRGNGLTNIKMYV